MTHTPTPTPADRLRVFTLAAALATFSTACSSFEDQAEVPGTTQRLVVGADAFGTPTIWVYEDGKCERVKIERKEP